MIALDVCKICDGERLFTIRTYHVRSKTSEEWSRVSRDVISTKERIIIRLVMCRDCGFFFYRDVFDPEELSLLYQTEHRFDKLEQSSKKAGRKWEVDAMKRFLLGWDELRSVKTAIDVGAGDFSTLESILPLFPRAKFEAIDPSYEKPEHQGIPVHKTMLENFHVDQSYDLVLVTHVLEHVSNFNGFMGQIFRLAEKYLYVEVPYQVGIGLLRNASVNPQHINYFTPETISLLLERSGFRVLSLEFDTDGYRHIGMPGMIRVSAEKDRAAAKSGIGCVKAIFRLLDPTPFVKAFKRDKCV